MQRPARFWRFSNAATVDKQAPRTLCPRASVSRDDPGQIETISIHHSKSNWANAKKHAVTFGISPLFQTTLSALFLSYAKKIP